MKPILSEELVYEILSVVEEIPEGHVASYGQIAQLIGRERNSRLVGKVLSMADDYGDYPCHLLESEGVQFKKNGTVDMQRFQWKP